MNATIDACTWTTTGIAAALPWLLDRSGNGAVSGSATTHEAASLADALTAAAAGLDVHMTGITCAFEGLGDCLQHIAPVVVALPGGAHALFIVRATRRRAFALTSDGRRVGIAMADLAQRLVSASSDSAESALGALTDELGRNTRRVTAALRSQRGAARPLFVGWTFEPRFAGSAGRDFSAWHCIPLLVTHLLQYALWLSSWAALVAVLAGVGDQTSLTLLWIALLASALALLPVESSLEQSLAARIGIAVKRSLFADALGADKRQVGRLGLGHMIAQSLETHHLDSMAARGGVRVALAALDVMLICAAYAATAGADALLALFALVLGLGGYYARDYYRQAADYLARNVDVTSVHTEQLVGHRTRKAFVDPQRWNADEDTSIARYHEAGRRFDDAQLRVARIPRVWTVLALFVVLTTLYRDYGAQAGVASILMIGFIVTTFAALQAIVAGVSEAIRAAISYRQLNRLDRDTAPDHERTGSPPAGDGELVCRGVSYHYPGALTPVLASVDLEIASHDRVLLTGRSGSGKSTLAAVLAGRIQQDSGVVLSGGLDRHITGMTRWRRLVCYVPQVATNHVLTETFAFNLLLGRTWPPTPQDLDDAWAVVRALGLDALLERMPAGMMQMVGEGGWALSQGEKARLFIARGILQGARLLIADEVLSPLDASSALKTLDALERHDGRLMLIAHS